MDERTNIEIAGMLFSARVISKEKIKVYGIEDLKRLHALYDDGGFFPMRVPLCGNQVVARIGCINAREKPRFSAEISFEFPAI